MKTRNLKVLMLLLFFLASVVAVDAQRGGRRRGGTTPATTNPSDTTKPQEQQQVNNNTTPTNFNAYGNVPIRVTPSSGGFNDTVKQSLRRDGPFDKLVANRMPLPYEDLRADDALFQERVWRE